MQYKNNTKQRFNTIQGLRSLKDTLPKNIKKVINNRGQIYSETLNNWKLIIGDDLFKVCYPKSFKNSNKFGVGTLIIMVKRGHEVDLEYSKKIIIEKVNKYFEQNILKNIKLITFEGVNDKFKIKQNDNVTKSEYTKKISNIKNDKIKNSLLEMSKYFKKI